MIDELEKEHNRLKAKYQAEKAKYKSAKQSLMLAEHNLKVQLQAQEFVMSVAETLQNEIHSRVAKIVERCLNVVFGDNYKFSINFDTKRGGTSATFVLKKGDIEIDPSNDECGGGILDVIAFGLRLSSLVMTRPRKRQLLVLDEPFRFVSEQYLPRVKELLEDLSKELEVQLIIVTHDSELRAGVVYSISSSKAKEL